MDNEESFEKRVSPLAMGSQEFRALGSQLVDRIASFLDSLPERRVTPGESPADARQALGAERSLPQKGADPARLLNHAADLLFEHSLFNGHPRFWGYITSSPAPIGALGELLAAAVNPNVGAWLLSPMASENGSPDYTVDCRNAGLLLGLRRSVCQRGKHGQYSVLARGPTSESGLGCAPSRNERHPSARLLLKGDAHVDSKGRGHLRARH
jgi:hypothetical protein